MSAPLLADGFEEAFVGVATRAGQPTLAVYDYEKAVEVLVTRDGMEHEEAVEYLDFNVLDAWVGEGTPLWLNRMPLAVALETGILDE